MTSEAQKKLGSDDPSMGTAYANQPTRGSDPRQAVNSAQYIDRTAITKDARRANPAVMEATPSSLGKPGWKFARPKTMWPPARNKTPTAATARATYRLIDAGCTLTWSRTRRDATPRTSAINAAA